MSVVERSVPIAEALMVSVSEALPNSDSRKVLRRHEAVRASPARCGNVCVDASGDGASVGHADLADCPSRQSPVRSGVVGSEVFKPGVVDMRVPGHDPDCSEDVVSDVATGDIPATATDGMHADVCYLIATDEGHGARRRVSNDGPSLLDEHRHRASECELRREQSTPEPILTDQQLGRFEVLQDESPHVGRGPLQAQEFGGSAGDVASRRALEEAGAVSNDGVLSAEGACRKERAIEGRLSSVHDLFCTTARSAEYLGDGASDDVEKASSRPGELVRTDLNGTYAGGDDLRVVVAGSRKHELPAADAVRSLQGTKAGAEPSSGTIKGGNSGCVQAGARTDGQVGDTGVGAKDMRACGADSRESGLAAHVDQSETEGIVSLTGGRDASLGATSGDGAYGTGAQVWGGSTAEEGWRTRPALADERVPIWCLRESVVYAQIEFGKDITRSAFASGEELWVIRVKAYDNFYGNLRTYRSARPTGGTQLSGDARSSLTGCSLLGRVTRSEREDRGPRADSELSRAASRIERAWREHLVRIKPDEKGLDWWDDSVAHERGSILPHVLFLIVYI